MNEVETSRLALVTLEGFSPAERLEARDGLAELLGPGVPVAGADGTQSALVDIGSALEQWYLVVPVISAAWVGAAFTVGKVVTWFRDHFGATVVFRERAGDVPEVSIRKGLGLGKSVMIVKEDGTTTIARPGSDADNVADLVKALMPPHS
jgi:hypothetical protein